MIISKRLFISPSEGSGIRAQHLKRQAWVDDQRLPDIRMVIMDYYRGAINDVIYIIIRNADHVMVSILSAEGREAEGGAAMNSSGVWSYRTAVANPTFPGGKVVVKAGNIRGDKAEVAVLVF